MENNETKNDSITLSKNTLYLGVIAVLAVLLVVSVFTGGFGFGSSNPAPTGNVVANNPAPTPTPLPSDNAAPVNAQALIDDDAVKGDKNAPVTIVEFSDYECPFCARFYSDTLSQIDAEYIKTGKVKLIVRDFPLSFHQQAQKAAEAAECAGEQGKYFEMHDKLFESGVAGGVTSFKQYAKDIGLNSGKFDDCLDTGKMASEIQKDFNDGQNAGIQGTPGFIVNGQMISGAQPFSAFKQVIDAELAK